MSVWNVGFGQKQINGTNFSGNCALYFPLWTISMQISEEVSLFSEKLAAN